jgi:2-phospho-L-lactate guanylyltransferase
MTTVAIVPLNRRSVAKSRLRGALDDATREALVRWMSRHVLAALRASEVIVRVAVVSPDEELLTGAAAAGAVALAQAEGGRAGGGRAGGGRAGGGRSAASPLPSAASPLRESGGLNEGLELGRRWALAGGADMLLVVLGDLPLLSASDVRAMVRMGGEGICHPRVVLAPDRREQGTNALLVRPPAALPFAFGPGSLARHLALARAHGVEPALFRSPGTSFDVDLPEDLDEVRRRDLWQPNGWLREVAAGGDAR